MRKILKQKVQLKENIYIKKQKTNELISKNINRYEIRIIESNELNNQKELEKKLLESRVGLENTSSSIYIVSILQAFIHSDFFFT